MSSGCRDEAHGHLGESEPPPCERAQLIENLLFVNIGAIDKAAGRSHHLASFAFSALRRIMNIA